MIRASSFTGPEPEPEPTFPLKESSACKCPRCGGPAVGLFSGIGCDARATKPSKLTRPIETVFVVQLLTPDGASTRSRVFPTERAAMYDAQCWAASKHPSVWRALSTDAYVTNAGSNPTISQSRKIRLDMGGKPCEDHETVLVERIA